MGIIKFFFIFVLNIKINIKYTVMVKFSKPFWVANFVELLERLAYYAVFIVITLYLSNVWGFSDIEAGVIAGLFSALFTCSLCLQVLMPIK